MRSKSFILCFYINTIRAAQAKVLYNVTNIE